MAIAQSVAPVDPQDPSRRAAVGRALWLPAIVALSYLPDVVSYLAVWFDYDHAQALGHSIPLGLIAGGALGAAWARATGAPFGRLALLAAAVVVLHDVFDMLQDHERMPFWPLWSREIGTAWLMFSETGRLAGELLVFGGPFAAFEVWHFLRRRGAATTTQVQHRLPGLTWLGGVLVALILIVVVGMLYLRNERRREMDEARKLVWAGKAQEALVAIERAERWPSSPGAGDLHRGEAYDRLGDRARAEAALLRAVKQDPDEFWPLAVLATHYASHGTADERRQRAARYVEELRRRFADHDALDRVVKAIEGRVQAAAGSR